MQSPEGGCMLACGYRLACGHACDLRCHPRDPQHLEYQCTKPCLKVLCDLGHICPKKCHVTCTKCVVPVERTMPVCGHKEMVQCHIQTADYKCREPCVKTLDCGHLCQNYCGSGNYVCLYPAALVVQC